MSRALGYGCPARFFFSSSAVCVASFPVEIAIVFPKKKEKKSRNDRRKGGRWMPIENGEWIENFKMEKKRRWNFFFLREEKRSLTTEREILTLRYNTKGYRVILKGEKKKDRVQCRTPAAVSRDIGTLSRKLSRSFQFFIRKKKTKMKKRKRKSKRRQKRMKLEKWEILKKIDLDIFFSKK
jgi:hypothetical protein